MTTETPNENLPVGQPVSAPPRISSSSKATLSLIMGVLSLACCGFFTGIPAILIGRSELSLIAKGESLESNRGLAKVGIVLGIVGTVLSFLAIVIYGGLLALGLSAGLMNNFN